MTSAAETRHMFEQLLKKAERSKGKDKKHLVNQKESEIVENLERSLKKDDPLSENNTFDEEADKNLKNLRNSGQVKGKENQDSVESLPFKRTHKTASPGVEKVARKRTSKRAVNNRSTESSKDEFSELMNRLFNKHEVDLNPSQGSEIPGNSLSTTTKLSSKKLEQARNTVTFCPNQNDTSSPRKLNLSDLKNSNKGPKNNPKKNWKSTAKRVSVLQTSNVPVNVTVMDIHSVANIFDTVWKKHSEGMNDKSIMSSLGKAHWTKVKSKVRSPDKTLCRSDLSNPSDNDRTSQSRLEQQTSINFTLECSPKETDINKAVWKSLSKEVLKRRRQGSDGSVHTSDPTHSGNEVLQDGMQLDLFEWYEKLLIEEFRDDTDIDGESLNKISYSEEKHAFWNNFWKKYGVVINYERQDTGRLIDDTVGSGKKGPKGKKKSRKKDETETTKEEAVYAVVNKPAAKKQSKQKDKSQNASGEKDQQNEQEPTPKPLSRKLRSKNVSEENVEGAETVPKTVEGQVDEATVPKTPVRRKRKKKTGGAASRPLPEAAQTEAQPGDEQLVEPQDGSTANMPPDQPAEPQIEDDGTILGVTVHYCDYIRLDPKYVTHPVAKVSIVDSTTGKFIRKQDCSWHVSSYYEGDDVNTIVPLMTQPYDFKRNGSLLPRWEEMLLFNESFTKLTNLASTITSNKPIIFFVIRDFIAMDKANNVKGGDEKGWHNIAWAFLKLISNNGQPNAGKRMRLQLFYPPRARVLQDPSVEMTHNWWLNYPRQRYPGTLYVTVKAIPPPDDMECSLRSHSALQGEASSLTYNQLNESMERSASESQLQDQLGDLAEIQQWSRLPGQTCKIPNAPLRRLWAGSDGAFMMQFSHRGTKLAVACRHISTYPILLYRIPSGDEIGVITGHQQLVYDLKWSKNDRFLLSASADGTAQVWDVEQREKPIQTLPHPCYVYTASYHPTASHLIATGGYDSIVRVWNIASQKSQLTQEMDGHKVIVNSIIFDSTGLNMFSGDGAGVIICWDCRSYEKAKKNVKTNWSMKYKIEDSDLAGICINHLQLHPRNNKILIHCRDSTVRLLDSRIHSVKKFTGLLNYRQLLRSSMTPCGSLIFSGSEDGCVYVWNVETGDLVATYNELGYMNAVHSVIYHPHDHIVAFCSYSPSQSILLYKFNSAVATMEAGFKQRVTDQPQEEDTTPSMNAHIEAAKTAVNLERIKSKLNSVLEVTEESDKRTSILASKPPDAPERPSISVSPFRRSDPILDSSFEDSSHQRGRLLAPSFLSPHASPEARAMAHQYIRAGRQDQKIVASVGGSPYNSSIAPDVSFTTDEDGKQMLNINAPPGTQQQCVVVVLFEYEANRSDELSVVRGDLIKVLYKDSANWWFGEKLSNGKQGYFPCNYVEEQVSTSNMQQNDMQTPVFGIPESTPEKKVYALKMPGGRLNFYSQSESEGDDDRLSSASNSSRQRRREAKLQNTFEKSRRIPSPLTVKSTPKNDGASPQPKSILLKESSRPKDPASDAPNIKEVSFADDKNEKNSTNRQNVLKAVQAALEQAEQDAESPSKAPSSQQNRQSKKPKPVSRKNSQKKNQRKSPSVEETTFIENQSTVLETQSTTPKLEPTSILKLVQASMNKNDESHFSQSIVGRPDVSTPTKSNASTFRPAVHSTAIKKLRGPVENEDEPLPDGSVVRRARPLPMMNTKRTDEETIPMVKMSRSKRGESSRSGSSNPAFVPDT